MSPYPDDAHTANQPAKTAQQRLGEIERSLQKRLNRKPTNFEYTALRHAALLALRTELAMGDPKADSLAIVRLTNASRRALRDFEKLISDGEKPKRRTMADIEREIAAHG